MNQNKWTEYKRKFYQDAVVHGLETAENAREIYPMGLEIPTERLNTWLARLREVPEVEKETPTRLVNHFKLGADPEFVFTQRKQMREITGYDVEGAAKYRTIDGPPQRVNADLLNLRQGQAFGADNNGRLVEVRPFPSRSALEVTASLLAALRWLAVTAATTRTYQWEAGAYKYQDGLGGHIHFGRKRPGRSVEIQALDVISEMMMSLGMFPGDEVAQRRQGDQFRQQYGLPGDFRLQGHGYEYRTLPSWLDSPWQTFFVITLAKLAVLNPELVLRFQGPGVPVPITQSRVRNLLGYYRGVDDDARLALSVLARRGFPRYRGGDFRERWGLSYSLTWAAPLTPRFIPPAIAPNKEDIVEMIEHLADGQVLRPRMPVPTWAPTEPPAGYEMLMDRVSTTHVKGLGELIWEMVGSMRPDLRMVVGGDRDGAGDGRLSVSAGLMRLIGVRSLRAECQKLGDILPYEIPEKGLVVRIPQVWREGAKGKAMKGFLLSGLFPIWSVFKAKSEDAPNWVAETKAKSLVPVVEDKFVGKTIFTDGN